MAGVSFLYVYIIRLKAIRAKDKFDSVIEILKPNSKQFSMGNLHEIAQIEPALMNGVAIGVKTFGFSALQGILASTPDESFYMNLYRKRDMAEIENLDCGNVNLQRVQSDTLTIASGGKMWCGYHLFIGRIRQMAPFLEDTLFLVADQVSMVDQFAIRGGQLEYSRVHEGGWCPLSEYIAHHFSNVPPSRFGYLRCN